MLASLSGPSKRDGNLDRVESIGSEIQPWTLQKRSQVLKAIENGKTLEKLLKDLSWYYLNRLTNLLGLKLLEL